MSGSDEVVTVYGERVDGRIRAANAIAQWSPVHAIPTCDVLNINEIGRRELSADHQFMVIRRHGVHLSIVNTQRQRPPRRTVPSCNSVEEIRFARRLHK